MTTKAIFINKRMRKIDRFSAKSFFNSWKTHVNM